MHCVHLSLTNFRNYVRLELDLPSEITVVVGGNGQGKSNLLEALYFLATTKSFRANSDRELINWFALETELSFARLMARVKRRQGDVKLEAVIREDSGVLGESQSGNGAAISKRLKLNDLARRGIDVIGAVNVVMFAPQDIELVNGAPGLRRRYLDVTISQVDQTYCRTLARYNRILLQRNHLLRQIRDRRARVDSLATWNDQLLATGAYIVEQRMASVSAISQLAREIHRRLTGSQETLQIGYRSSVSSAESLAADSACSATELAGVFRGQLAEVQGREIALGMSVVGPHRDDLGFLVDDVDLNIYGSRGQQRTVALGLKMAEAEFLRQRTGEQPILLLDDVLSELDEHRREHVLAAVASGQQVVLTSTELRDFDAAFLRRATVLRVEQGAIERVFEPAMPETDA